MFAMISYRIFNIEDSSIKLHGMVKVRDQARAGPHQGVAGATAACMVTDVPKALYRILQTKHLVNNPVDVVRVPHGLTFCPTHPACMQGHDAVHKGNMIVRIDGDPRR